MPLFKLATSIADIAFDINGLCRYKVAGKVISLALSDNKVFAFAEKCPHTGAPLADGYLDAKGCVVCPLHGYRFDIANGRNTTGEGYKLVIFPTLLKEDGWYVDIKE